MPSLDSLDHESVELLSDAVKIILLGHPGFAPQGKEVGVDDYLARLGREPRAQASHWAIIGHHDSIQQAGNKEHTPSAPESLVIWPAFPGPAQRRLAYPPGCTFIL